MTKAGKLKLGANSHRFVNASGKHKSFSPLSTETQFATLDFIDRIKRNKRTAIMRETSFLVVPFDADAMGDLQPGSPARLDSWEAAQFAAREEASFHSGIAIIEEPESAFAEPQIVEILGSVSSATLELFGTTAKVQNCGRLAERMRDFVVRAVVGASEREPAHEVVASISQKRQALRKLPRSCQRPTP